MEVKVGERVIVEPQTTGREPRRGEVMEILHGEPHGRYRIRWDDGHESIYTPADGALQPEREHAGTR